MKEKILIVDDDPEFRQELKEALDDYDVFDVPDGASALKLLSRAHGVSVVVLDVRMPQLSGTDVLRQIKRLNPDIAIIMLTGYSSKEVAIEALKAHADDFVEKPVDIAQLKETIARFIPGKDGYQSQEGLTLADKVSYIKRFVGKNINKKIALKDVAQSVFLSQKYTSRLFKKATGQDFSTYRITQKIKEGKRLLKQTGYTVNQIADKLAYENPESFIRQFKRFVHMTPRQYRLTSRQVKG